MIQKFDTQSRDRAMMSHVTNILFVCDSSESVSVHSSSARSEMTHDTSKMAINHEESLIHLFSFLPSLHHFVARNISENILTANHEPP